MITPASSSLRTRLCLKNIAKIVTRRSSRADVVIDNNADYRGRRPSGDARLELAYFERGLTSRR